MEDRLEIAKGTIDFKDEIIKKREEQIKELKTSFSSSSRLAVHSMELKDRVIQHKDKEIQRLKDVLATISQLGSYQSDLTVAITTAKKALSK